MRTNYTMYYSVADHLFAIEASAAQEALLTNYAPFRFSQEGPCAPLFTIHVQDASMPNVAKVTNTEESSVVQTRMIIVSV